MKLTSFSNNQKDSGKLLLKLREPTFLKTQLDIVYSDFDNWERHGLIESNATQEKSKWRKFSYTEYVWLKIIEELRKYGISFKIIKLFKKELTADYSPQQLYEASLTNIEKIRSIDPKAAAELLSLKDNPHLIEEHVEGRNQLDLLVCDSISTGINTSILFFINNIPSCVALSGNLIDEARKSEYINQYLNLLSHNHLSINLNNIIKAFCDHSTKTSGEYVLAPELLTETEYKILKTIRNKPKNVLEIAIKYKNQDADRIEVQSLKKVELESRILELIKKGEYVTIELIGADGHMISYKNTKKIKL